MSLGDIRRLAMFVQCARKQNALQKKEQGPGPAQKLCRPLFPRKVGFDLVDEATLLVRVRAPPETWTTKLKPLGQPEAELVDHLFRLVTIFSNDCSKFQHSAK